MLQDRTPFERTDIVIYHNGKTLIQHPISKVQDIIPKSISLVFANLQHFYHSSRFSAKFIFSLHSKSPQDRLQRHCL